MQRSDSGEPTVRMLPFTAVCRARGEICSLEKTTEDSRSIQNRSLERRIKPVLAGKGIVLKKLSTRLRCYMDIEKLEKAIGSLALNSNPDSNELSIMGIRRQLDEVVKQFIQRKEQYWKGEWSLSEEVSLITSSLRTFFVLLMASQRRTAEWRIASSAAGKRLHSMFPVSNKPETLPQPSIEHALNDPTSSYHRADLLICIRVLKVVEQIVFSRTHSCAGPFTVCTSVAGINEISPSFVSVLNSIGVCLSYDTTERFRMKLIAEREKFGPWHSDNIDKSATVLCQFDNWDIKPLHSVKVDGKQLPKVNGSLLQGLPKKKRQRDINRAEHGTAKRQKLEMTWKNTKVLGNRTSFSQNFLSTDNVQLLKQFNDTVFGLVCFHRHSLLGGKNRSLNEYNTGTSPEYEHDIPNPVNFRTLLLSAFKQHGGRDPNDDSLFDRHVVYVEVSRESAADLLTVRRFIQLLEDQIRPGEAGRPRYVVLGGDQPSFKMYGDLWLDSWRKSDNSTNESQPVGASNEQRAPSRKLKIHEWLVPIPGFFHAEKQAMYSLYKEMLDGVGLQELASCAGLSQSIVSKILKHSHARNNRAVLFNLCCAMILHVIDIVTAEDSVIEKHLKELHAQAKAKPVSSESGERFNLKDNSTQSDALPSGDLYNAASGFITKTILAVGKMLHEKVSDTFSTGPNGKHFVTTVLFTCLLPTVGFHVLSRTGHTDFIDAFWYRHNSILHASNHLKYQELSLFYAFFRGIIPEAIESELYKTKPGKIVTKLISFTGMNRSGYDRRGWTYVHLDESLEMMIVRHLKGLNVNFISHLENSAAWLLEVSMLRSLARLFTGASRAYGRKRLQDDTGEQLGPLNQFDRNTIQWKTVSRMLHMMREVGFLNYQHRGAEWLTNVFSSPPQRLNIKQEQEKLLQIEEHGRLSAELHLSAVLPEVFGPLTASDRVKHFYGKKFKNGRLRESF